MANCDRSIQGRWSKPRKHPSLSWPLPCECVLQWGRSFCWAITAQAGEERNYWAIVGVWYWRRGQAWPLRGLPLLDLRRCNWRVDSSVWGIPGVLRFLWSCSSNFRKWRRCTSCVCRWHKATHRWWRLLREWWCTCWAAWRAIVWEGRTSASFWRWCCALRRSSRGRPKTSSSRCSSATCLRIKHSEFRRVCCRLRLDCVLTTIPQSLPPGFCLG